MGTAGYISSTVVRHINPSLPLPDSPRILDDSNMSTSEDMNANAEGAIASGLGLWTRLEGHDPF